MGDLSDAGERRHYGAGRACQGDGAGDNSAAEDTTLALRRLIEDAGLTRRHAVFTVDQLDFKTIIATVQPGGLWRARRAGFDIDFTAIADRLIDGAIAEPVDIAQPNATGAQRLAW